jgi:hypothetical protein
MIRILLLILGIAFSLVGSNNTIKEATVSELINSGPGTYNVYGTFTSDRETGQTLIAGDSQSLSAWGCEYCNGYGKAVIEKRGSDLTIKNFNVLSKFKTIAEVIEIDTSLNKAVLKINNKTVNTSVEVKRISNKAYLINETWVIK